jgi:hypothetical protein
MLGIESHLSAFEEVCNLSVSSNQQNGRREKNSAVQSSSNSNAEVDSYPNQTANAKNERIRQLRMRMQEIEKNQTEMDSRMKTFITLAESEVKKKEQQNLQMEALISSLQSELLESRSDLKTLSNYVCSKLGNNKREETKSEHSSALGVKNVLSFVSNNKDAENKDPKSVSNRSPCTRLVLTSKPDNQNPANGEEKKGSYIGIMLSSPFKRKPPSSPFK